MATSGSSHLEAIDEKFCQCSICLQQYREPKLLPCLHRYCSDCLKQLIERNQGIAVISCPECRVEVKVPTEGVDGFKTDFHMKNIVEYIQIQKSVEHEQLLQCSDCSSIVAVKAYCFKCNGFLCTDCHNHHVTKRSLEDHKQYTLSLEDLKSKDMTLEKLTDLKEAPRCQSHLNDLCLLCCATCNELPICVTCVHGRHKNHDVRDVEIIAAEEREKLQRDVKNLNQYKKRTLKMPRSVTRIKESVISNFRERNKNSRRRYEKAIQNVKGEMERTEENYEQNKTEIKKSKEKELTETKKQMDAEINQIKKKYDSVFDEIEHKSKGKLDSLRKENEERVESIKDQLSVMEMEFRNSIDASSKQHDNRLAKLEEISQQIDGIISRYKALTETADSLLVTRNNWTAVQCIPDIRKAIEPLIQDMKKQFLELDKSSRMGRGLEIEEDEESPMDIEGDEWKIDGITGVGDDSIVVTGHYSSGQGLSHIAVIGKDGKVKQRQKFKGTEQWARRYCSCLSRFEVATVCWDDDIVVFDLRDYSYVKKNFRDVTRIWSANQNVACVTTDPVKNHILMGNFDSRVLYVFDSELNYHHTFTLPENIKFPRDMAINKSTGKLIVCDIVNRKVYGVSVDRQKGNISYELKKPDLDEDYCAPLSVCTDSNGLIYVLWTTSQSFSGGRKIVVQYSQDGSRSLTQNEINSDDARCVTTLKTNMTEKLLVATRNSGKLHIYTII